MPTFTKRAPSDKQFKNIIIFDILREKGEASRADLTALTKINAVSISNYTNSFIHKGLVIEREVGASSGGRPPILLELNKGSLCAIGVHVTKSSVKGIAVNLGIKKLYTCETKLEAKYPKESIKQTINSLKENIGTRDILGIGLSVEDVDISVGHIEEDIEKKFSLPMYTCMPAMSAAYTESILKGHCAENKSLYSYNDLGDCVFLEGVEFLTPEEKDKDRLYLMPWGSNMGIVCNATRMIKQGVGTEMLNLAKGSVDNIKTMDVFNAARKGDTLAIEILEFVGLNLGVRLAYLINIFKPERIILGGGVRNAGNYFIEAVKKSIGKLAEDKISRKVEISYSSSSNGDAVAAGAAALVIRETFMGV